MSGSGSSLFGFFPTAEAAQGFMARVQEFDGACATYGPFRPALFPPAPFHAAE